MSKELKATFLIVGSEGLHPLFPHHLEHNVVWLDDEGKETKLQDGRPDKDVDYSRCFVCKKQFYIGGRDSACEGNSHE